MGTRVGRGTRLGRGRRVGIGQGRGTKAVAVMIVRMSLLEGVQDEMGEMGN